MAITVTDHDCTDIEYLQRRTGQRVYWEGDRPPARSEENVAAENFERENHEHIKLGELCVREKADFKRVDLNDNLRDRAARKRLMMDQLRHDH
ncbi:hypothetical protein PPGU19_088940 (plasmid) [Paraburkholderia sp. PGU19]|nr:hypothetical protein PPGU19_088940 [Paraburkholderia sp. PGU19]